MYGECKCIRDKNCFQINILILTFLIYGPLSLSVCSYCEKKGLQKTHKWKERWSSFDSLLSLNKSQSHSWTQRCKSENVLFSLLLSDDPAMLKYGAATDGFGMHCTQYCLWNYTRYNLVRTWETRSRIFITYLRALREQHVTLYSSSDGSVISIIHSHHPHR